MNLWTGAYLVRGASHVLLFLVLPIEAAPIRSLDGFIWPKAGFALTVFASMASPDFLPLGYAHSSRGKKALRRHPPLRSGPYG